MSIRKLQLLSNPYMLGANNTLKLVLIYYKLYSLSYTLLNNVTSNIYFKIDSDESQGSPTYGKLYGRNAAIKCN